MGQETGKMVAAAPARHQLSGPGFQGRRHLAAAGRQKETQQPAAFLKEVLGGIATYVKKGPVKDMWVVKKDYANAGARTAGEALDAATAGRG